MGNMRDLALPVESGTEPADKPAKMNIALVALALVIFAVGALGAFSKPKYDWDLVAYVGLVNEQRYDTAAEIHATTYETVRAAVPDDVFEVLNTKNERRETAFADPVSFEESLSFYRIRVGYWGLGSLLAKLGLDEVTAYQLIAVVFYFAVCAVVLWHLAAVLPSQSAVLILSVLVALYPPLLNLARSFVPDSMALVGVVLGFSLLLRHYLLTGAVILFAMVFVRTDLGILCAFLAVPVFFVGEGPRSRRLCAAAILCAAVPTVLMINAAFGHVGWAKLITTWFFGTLYYPVSAEAVTVDLWEYAKIVLKEASGVFQVVSLWVTLVLSIVILRELDKRGTFKEPLLLWLGALIAYLPTRFVLWPLLLERYVILFPILFLLVLVGIYAKGRTTGQRTPA